jgi:hypothetical protein
MSRKRDDISADDVARRIAAGETRAAIAKSLNMSASSLSHWCRANGVPLGTGNMRKHDRDAMPDGLDVRTVDEVPHFLFGEDGAVYSTFYDPPLKVSGTVKAGGNGERVRCRIRASGSDFTVPREMCRAWHGEPRPGEIVDFIDGDCLNFRPDNLQWRLPKQSVSDRDFVMAWQRSESVREVADKLGLVPSGVITRGKRLMKSGVPLRQFLMKMDVDDLIKLAEEEMEL